MGFGSFGLHLRSRDPPHAWLLSQSQTHYFLIILSEVWAYYIDGPFGRFSPLINLTVSEKKTKKRLELDYLT